MIRMRLRELREVLSRHLLAEMVVPGLKPWPEESKQIPETSEADLAAKIGPFERRLAAVLGGDVVGGGNKSYDIVAAGTKYEVKKPDKANEIRIGGEGMLGFAEARARIEETCKAINDVFGQGDRQIARAAAADVMSPEDISRVEAFTLEIPAILKGNLGTARMREFHQVLRLIAAAIVKEGREDPKQILMGDDEHVIDREIDTKTYVKIGQVLGVSPEELHVTQSDVLSMAFSSSAFQDPDAFMRDNWSSAVSASSVFNEVDFLALVTSAGYRIIPIEELDSVVTFNRLANGRMLFRVTG